MKTLRPHPVTADSLRFRHTLDTMIHARAPFWSRADCPSRMNVGYKKLHIQGPSEGPGWEGEIFQGAVREARTAWRRLGKEQRAGHHSSEDASVLCPHCSAELHAAHASGPVPPPELQTAPD